MQAERFMTSKEYARLLRKNLTKEESIMWNLLRNRKFLVYKFLRQHPIKVWETTGRYHFYYADFYCAEKKLVIEIDGLIHCQQEEYDQSRDFILYELKYHVLRISNEDVNENLVDVMKKITSILNSSPDPFSMG